MQCEGRDGSIHGRRHRALLNQQLPVPARATHEDTAMEQVSLLHQLSHLETRNRARCVWHTPGNGIRQCEWKESGAERRDRSECRYERTLGGPTVGVGVGGEGVSVAHRRPTVGNSRAGKQNTVDHLLVHLRPPALCLPPATILTRLPSILSLLPLLLRDGPSGASYFSLLSLLNQQLQSSWHHFPG